MWTVWKVPTLCHQKILRGRKKMRQFHKQTKSLVSLGFHLVIVSRTLPICSSAAIPHYQNRYFLNGNAEEKKLHCLDEFHIQRFYGARFIFFEFLVTFFPLKNNSRYLVRAPFKWLASAQSPCKELPYGPKELFYSKPY